MRAVLSLSLLALGVTACDPGRTATVAAPLVPPNQAEGAVAGTPADAPIVLMWQVQQTGPRGDFARLRALGVTAVQSSRLATWTEQEVRAYLDAAAREGLDVFVYLGIFREGQGADCRYSADAARFVATWKSHPAIHAWHSVDEPAGHGVTPACQRALYREIKRLDPSRPVMISTNTDSERAFADYYAEDAFDIYETHKYVNPQPAGSQQRLVELVRRHRTRDFPLIITLRAFNAPAKPLRRPMSPRSFDEQYEFFITRPGLTRNFGFYGWDLAPNRGISNDPDIYGEFVSFMESRRREWNQGLR